MLLDGADVREVDLRSLRRAVAVVSDDPFLFSATVAENIAYARPAASLAEIEQAARRAQAHEFIARLPQGYPNAGGRARASRLSGGQRQRLAIARALLADPRVLILDDATSSVDSSTERLIKLALDEAMAGRTTFIIAHRLSTIALADEIVVLDHGRIVAHGDHAAAARGLRALPRNRRQGPARADLPDAGAARGGGERTVTPERFGGGGAAALRRGGTRRWRARARRDAAVRGGRSGPANGRAEGSRGRNLRGLLELLRPYRLSASAGCSARSLLGTAASLAPPLLAKVAIDQGIVGGQTQTLARWSLPRSSPPRCSSGLMTSAQTYLVGWVGQRALADLRLRIFTHLQRQPIGFYESRPAGVLISRMTNDVEALESLVTDSVVTLFQAGLTLIGAVAVLLYLDVRLALLTLCIVPFVAAG